MPRRARIVPLHLIQRGSNRPDRYLAEDDCPAWTLTTKHVHLLVTPHALCQSPGRCAPERANAYRELCRHERDPGLSDEIRGATTGRFALGVRAPRGRGGRPGNNEEPESLPLPGLE